MRWHAHSVASSLCGMFVRLVPPVYELCLAAELATDLFCRGPYSCHSNFLWPLGSATQS